MSTWHAHPANIAAYAAGTLMGPSADSLEAHLLGCAECREQVAHRVPVSDDVWQAITSAIEAPPRSAVERLLVRIGVPDHTARLLAATPSLRGAWLLAVTASLTFAAIAARLAPGARGFAAFLIVAPLVPLAGIAAAYSRGSGGSAGFMAELETAAPAPNERILLLRAVAVLAVSSLLGAAAGAVGLGHLGWAAAAWLLPSLALTAATLAAATAVPLRLAAALLGGAWLLVTTLAVRAAADPLAVFGALTQGCSLLVVLAGAAIVAGRHAHLDLGGAR